MAWNLQITPKGLLLSKYIKNTILLNPQNINGIEQGQALSDQYQTYFPNNNTSNIYFTLDIFNDDPRDDSSTPSIVGINFVSISNDPSFSETFTLNPGPFNSPYSSQTNYSVDLGQFNIVNTTLPAAKSTLFSENNGSGVITILGWPLSGSSGLKRVFLSLGVQLSDGTNAVYPNSLDIYDEITVLSSTIASPGQPIAINSFNNYVSAPVYLEANISSSSGLTDTKDRSICAYFWDNFLLNSNNNIYRNYKSGNSILFNTAPLAPSNLNSETFPIVFANTPTLGLGNTAAYNDYISPNALQLSATNNIYFAEFHLNSNYSPNYINGANSFFEFNLVNSTNPAANTKFIRQQLVTDISYKTLTIYTSVDDSAWSASGTYTPSSNFTVQSINNPELVSKVFQGGVFISLLEIIDQTNNVFQSKLLYKSENENNFYVLNEQIFSSSLALATNIYCEFRGFFRNSTSNIIIEGCQYGVAFGMMSAGSMPTEKIDSNLNLPLFFDYSKPGELDTWFIINNSPYSGLAKNDSNNNLILFGHETATSENNLTGVEVQSSIPTFSNENIFNVDFQFNSNNTTMLKAGWSLDNKLNFSDFTFSNLLLSSVGESLPQNLSTYNIFAQLSWSGGGEYDLTAVDGNTAETCGINTVSTTNLFFYSSRNNNGTLQSPTVIKTKENLNFSDTFIFGINTNGNSLSNILSKEIIISNTGQLPLNVSVGLSTTVVSQGDVYSIGSISTNVSSPTQFSVLANNVGATTSVNFLYDFTQAGNINTISLSVQITNPPDCPANLPSFEYSIEVSNDFLNWTYLQNSSLSSYSFDPNTGKMAIAFSTPSNSGDSNLYRYARLRIYYDPAYTFDPRSTYSYSNLAGSQTGFSNFINNGKVVFGFTDTSAKSSSLGQLYNQLTYLRQYITNSSKIIAVVLDFTTYDSNVGGPVLVNLLTENGEITVRKIIAGFMQSSVYNATLSVIRSNINDAYKLKPIITISGLNLGKIEIDIENFLIEPIDSQGLSFGYYPFISLMGNGNVSFNNTSLVKGLVNSISSSSEIAYFSLFTSENADCSAVVGKNLLAQNTISQSAYSFPQVGLYFSANQIQFFDYQNTTFTVRVASTAPMSMYGLTYTDGIYLAHCDYILLAGQQDKSQNGIYQVQLQQWLKIDLLSILIDNGQIEPTILVSEGNIFTDTLWMQDLISSEWIPNIIVCPLVISQNQLLTSQNSLIYNYPQYIRMAVGVGSNININSQNQVKLKISNSPTGLLSDTDATTQWNSILQNGSFDHLNVKSNSNNTVYMNYSISSSQIVGIATVSYPACYNLIISFSGNYLPEITKNSDFSISDYGNKYRTFINPNIIYQAYSSFDSVIINQISNNYLNSSLYALNEAGIKSPQSGFSTDYIVDNTAPVVGTLSKLEDEVKIIYLGLSTVLDNGSGLALGRIVQQDPINQVIYGSWFSMNNSSFYGVSSFVAFPAFVKSLTDEVVGEPLSGFYRYSLQVVDNIGNVAQTNEVESFYYETALIDTQGPSATVGFVGSDYVTPISITSSSVVTAKLSAKDLITDVKAYRYRILPEGDWNGWVDFESFADIYIPDTVDDGIVSAEFQFKDFANNVLYSDTTISGENVYVYTWNIVSKLINNALFTVTERSTYNNKSVLLIGASKSNKASLYIWDSSKLIELQYSGFVNSNAIAAMKTVDNSVVIGDNLGNIFVYQNGIITGPFAQLTCGGGGLPISKFEVHQFSSENVSYIYATTLNIPRIFRTATNNLKSLSWQTVQTPPIYLESINVLNTGLWSGNSIYYSISSSSVLGQLSAGLNYGISSVIISNAGSNYRSAPTLTANGVSGASFSLIMQGSLGPIQKITSGVGYTSGATLQISPPASGGIQATGTATTNSIGQISSIGLTSTGYGYTQIPSVSIIGVNGIGSQASAAITNVVFDSIYSVNVVSSGIATTSQITLSLTGVGANAVLTPTILYRISSLAIANPGFGYTSSPSILINGLSTIASAAVMNGSIQSVKVLSPEVEFPIYNTLSLNVVGGISSGIALSFSTSSVVFTNGSVNYNGTVLNKISVNGGGFGLGTSPFVSFSSTKFSPQISYVFSDDILLSNPYGSIYDIKSFNNKLFITNSNNGFLELDYINSNFKLKNINIDSVSSDLNGVLPIKLAEFENSLYFTTNKKAFVGTLSVETQSSILGDYKWNILLFSPQNMDVLTDWQLVKNYNLNGISTVSATGINSSLLLISTQNCQTFYESTKTNVWFNRCKDNNDYAVTFIFEALSGTQAFEISNFVSTLKISFTVASNGLIVSYGNKTIQSILINISDVYNITAIKNGNNLYIYNENVIISSNNTAFDSLSVYPVIKFGYIFEPQTVVVNKQSVQVFGTPSSGNFSNFIWHQIKFGFSGLTPNIFDSYNTDLQYVLPNAESVRVLKNLDGNLFAVTKSIKDYRSTTNISDFSSKVYQFTGKNWNDVTGNYENYVLGINTTYTIVSPNDIGNLGGSYFLTGIVNNITSKHPLTTYILLGLSTNISYEEQDLSLTILYPYNPFPAGTFLTITSNNSLITVNNQIYFGQNDYIKIINVGIGATSIVSTAQISVSDGVNTSNIGITVNPIGISSFYLNTGSFVGYSSNYVNSTLTLQAKVKTNRTYTLMSNNPLLLSTTNSGVSTVKAGNISDTVVLGIGSAVASLSTISITASYRTGIYTAQIKDNPFILSLGVNTNSFFGNQFYGKIYVRASLQSPPKRNVNVSIISSQSGVLSLNTIIIPAGSLIGTSLAAIGAAVTTVSSISLTGIVTGSISTALITAQPYTIVSATTDISRPILGLQTSNITFTLNTTPTNNLMIKSVIVNPVGVNMVFPGFSTVLGGGISTSFGISTTVQTSSGLGITVQGAPLGFNTTPTSALTLVSDIWRIINFQVSPGTIVGAGANINGIAQSFIIGVGLNYSAIGVSTTITLVTSSPYVGLTTTLLVMNGVSTATGFATGFSTSIITGASITAYGPQSLTSSVNNLTVTPFLISSFTISPVWNGGYSTNYLVGGIGATAIGTIKLNAYTFGIGETIKFSSQNNGIFVYNQSPSIPFLGLATINVGANSTTINFGAGLISQYISTSITATLLASSLGIATTTININSIPSYSAVFNPIFPSSYIESYSISLSSPLPIGVGVAVTFSNGLAQTFNVSPSTLGVSTSFGFSSFLIDTLFSVKTNMLGVLQTYYVTGYAKSGGAFAMGYNMSGELSKYYPASGSQGSAKKIYMRMPNVVKVVSGNHHNLVLDSTGSVYGIGDNTYGQLAYTNTAGLTTSTFKKINFSLPIKNIYAQNNSSYVIAANNSLYGFGDNYQYCLGTSVGFNTSIPYLISTSVLHFSAFNYRGAIVKLDNQNGIQTVYEFGLYQPSAGLIGKGITQLSYLGNIRNISGLNISAIDVGPAHTVASATWIDSGLGINSSGVFAWGDNTYYQTGGGLIGTYSTPNVLHKINVSGAIVPIETSNLIFADYNFSMVVGVGNSIYFVGMGNTYNNVSVANGVAATSLAQYPAYGFSTSSPIYKIAKNKKHYVWTVGMGSVYVSGGAQNLSLQRQSYNNNADLIEYAMLSGDKTALTAPTGYYDYVFFNGSDLWQVNSSGNLGSVDAPANNEPVSGSFICFASQPTFGDGASCWISGNTATLFWGNWIYFYPNAPWTQQNTINIAQPIDLTFVYPTQVDYFVVDDLNRCFWAWGINQANTSTINIFNMLFKVQYLLSDSGLYGQSYTPSFNTPTFTFSLPNLAGGNPVAIEGNFIIGFKGTTVNLPAPYDAYTIWLNSCVNFVIGYDNGIVELYGTPYQSQAPGGATTAYAFNTPAFIANYTCDSAVSVMLSMKSGNNLYLIIATVGGGLYSFNSLGGDAVTQTTGFPTLLSNITIPSVYGYITYITAFTGGSFLAGTSNNYVLVISNGNLNISAVSLVGTKIDSIGYYTSGGVTYIEVTTKKTSKKMISNVYYLPSATNSYEIGLNFANSGGGMQLLTNNGAQNGIGVSNIYKASTSDSFTIIIDSSRPRG